MVVTLHYSGTNFLLEKICES